MKRKICFFTGTRAEYGLLKPLIDEFKIEKTVELQLIITGMHLSPEFGSTYTEIELDGIDCVEKVEILLSSDTPIGVSKAMGLGMISFSEALERVKPDLLVGLGDRFELLALASSALVQRIPFVHIHGGEITSGAYDDAFRHSITKMAMLHFTSTEVYRNRVIQLGENPKTVFNVGALGIDNLKRMKLLTLSELEASISFPLNSKYFVVTFHPTTLESISSEKQMGELLDALSEFRNYKIIFTKANADNGGRCINRMIDKYIAENSDTCIAFDSLGQLRYLSAVKHAELVVGNSSSGIIETQFFGIPTINIGDRQKGRVLSQNIIQCEPTKRKIVSSMKLALKNDFKNSCKSKQSIYGNGTTARKIKKILVSQKYPLMKKEFYNVNMDYNS